MIADAEILALRQKLFCDHLEAAAQLALKLSETELNQDGVAIVREGGRAVHLHFRVELQEA